MDLGASLLGIGEGTQPHGAQCSERDDDPPTGDEVPGGAPPDKADDEEGQDNNPAQDFELKAVRLMRNGQSRPDAREARGVLAPLGREGQPDEDLPVRLRFD